jgi:hypothetical protein
MHSPKIDLQNQFFKFRCKKPLFIGFYVKSNSFFIDETRYVLLMQASR